MFADDFAYIFDTREELVDATNEIRLHFRCFGLRMHFGTINTLNGKVINKSKTEAMYFPAGKMSQSEMKEATANMVFGENDEHFVPFTAFKYLGCYIHQSLKDKYEIKSPLKSASNQVAALQNFFNSSADFSVKRLIFLAIPVNTALYGCESWTLTDKLHQLISSFYHKGICRVLRINMFQVEEFRIRNKHICNVISLPHILDIVRQ